MVGVRAPNGAGFTPRRCHRLLRYMYNNRFISILIRSASVEEGADFLKARPPIGCLSFLMLGFLNARL